MKICNISKCYIMIRGHNDENRVSNAINSVLKQDYKNTEIIFLDDNSTDNTLNIVKNIKNSSNFSITIIEKHNNSPAISAEQILHETSKQVKDEDIVLMLDSDDSFSKNTILSDIVNKMQRTQSNICGLGFSYEFESEEAKNLILQAGMGVPHNQLMQELNSLDNYTTVSQNYDIFTKWGTPMWNKAIKGDIFKKYVSLLPHFDKNSKVCEDFPTILILLFNASKITAIPEAYTFYKHKNSSTAEPKISDFTIDRIGFLNIINDIYKNNSDLFIPETKEMIKSFFDKKYNVISNIIEKKIEQGYLKGFSVLEFQKIFHQKIKL